MSPKSRNKVTSDPAPAAGHGTAIALTIAAAALNSAGGIVVRSLETATEWQVVFWRCATLAVAIIGIVLAQNRHALRTQLCRVGVWSLIGGVFYGITLVGYVLALTNTTVANADFTMSSIPVFTAFLAWAFLGEVIRWKTLLAILASVGGIAIMVGDGIAAGTVLGNTMAIIAALSFACFVVILRKAHTVDMLPTAAVGAVLAAGVAAFKLDGGIAVSAHDLTLCLIWGGVLSCAAHVLIIIASRKLAGAELTLLLLIEFILGPTWVWLFVNEEPSAKTLLGGAIVLGSVAAHTASSMLKKAA
jgi:drug/metabolite transporter (DMT)-like permease